MQKTASDNNSGDGLTVAKVLIVKSSVVPVYEADFKTVARCSVMHFHTSHVVPHVHAST
jgi:hypothetical protein